ncbi:MAG TPA: DUF4010 domain-containing protein, partial [Deltaproteobacteria bacterium]|nr:DUF4010 domain-containing protein [Deltaproteobacteria bacterium]
VVKLVGPEQGAGLTGLVGGLVSSTAVTLGLSQKSRSDPGLSRALALGVMSSWTVMYLRVMVIAVVLNMSLFTALWKAMLGLFAVSCAYCLYLYTSHRGESGEEARTFRNPFELLPAITFGVLYAVILLGVNTASIFFGDTMVYVSSLISGLLDVDAITLSMSRLSGMQGGLHISVASRAVVIACAANTFLKGAMVLAIASSGVRRLVIPGTCVILAAQVLAVVLI